MDFRKIRFETVLYSFIFLLALFLRLFDLGKAPLSDIEAGWALQALQIAQPAAPAELEIGPQPLYVFLTGISFALFEPGNFLARFWPALCGALLVVTPFFFRRWLGRAPAILMAAGLALDPGITAIARQAGSPVMAVCLALFALGFFFAQKNTLAGIFAGLAFLSGPAIFTGILCAVLAWLASKRLVGVEAFSGEKTNATVTRQFLLSAAAAIILVGSLFFRQSYGLSALGETLSSFITGLARPSGVSAAQILAASILYQPFAWLFAIAGTLRWLFRRIYTPEKASLAALFPILGAAIMMLFISLYPARTTGDLAWLHLFLWAVAARELSAWLVIGDAPVISAIQAALLVLMFAMLWNILLSNYQVTPETNFSWNAIRALVITGIIGLAGLTSILIAYGWSWQASRSGLVSGAILISLVYSTFVLWSASQLRTNSPLELLSPRQTTADTRLFSNTLQDLSLRNTGMPGLLDIVSVVDKPSLRWVLRAYPQTRFAAAIPASETPAIIITPVQQDQPLVGTAYRGQDFPWTLTQGWQGALPENFLSWFTMRRAPITQEVLILWARTDLFPGGQALAPQGSTP